MLIFTKRRAIRVQVRRMPFLHERSTVQQPFVRATMRSGRRATPWTISERHQASSFCQVSLPKELFTSTFPAHCIPSCDYACAIAASPYSQSESAHERALAAFERMAAEPKNPLGNSIMTYADAGVTVFQVLVLGRCNGPSLSVCYTKATRE
jgi:hypothetical protein